MDKGRGLWTAGRAGLLASVLGLLSFVHPFAAQAASSDYSGWRKSDGTPQSVMLSYYDGPDTRGFAWQTSTSVSSGALWLLKGEWDSSTGNFDTNQVATATSTKQSTECYTHKAHVLGLTAGTWSYRLGTASHYAYGKFTVRDNPTSFVVLNVNDVQTKTASKLNYWTEAVAAASSTLGAAANVDTIISGGDFIDGSIDVSGLSNYVQWGVVADKARPAFADVAWTMASGNHDPSLYNVVIDEHFQHTSSGHYGCHSYVVGNVYVASIPYYDSWQSSTVGNWLENDLATDAARSATWRIVSMHYGPYTTGDHGASASGAIVTECCKICANGKVDLVLQAHDHTFSKTLPYLWSGNGYSSSATDATAVNLKPATVVIGGQTYYDNPEGTVYISAGCAGHRVGEQDSYTSTYNSKRTYKIAMDTVKVESKYMSAGSDASKDVGRPMFGVLTIEEGLLAYDFYAAETTGAATLVDTLRISKAPPEPPHDEDETITLEQDGTKTITTIASQEVWNYEITSGEDCISVVCEPNDDFTANFTFTALATGTATVVIRREDDGTPLKTVTVTVLPPDPMTTPIKTPFNRATVTTVGAVIDATDPSGDLILIYTNTAAPGSLVLQQDESARILVIGGGGAAAAGGSNRYGSSGNGGRGSDTSAGMPAGTYSIQVGVGGQSACAAGGASSIGGADGFAPIEGQGAAAQTDTSSHSSNYNAGTDGFKDNGGWSDITGESLQYGAGGAKASNSSGKHGTDGAAGTGNGGVGGYGSSSEFGKGGSGIVVVRLKYSEPPVDRDETLGLFVDESKTVTTIAAQANWTYRVTGDAGSVHVDVSANDDGTATFTFTGLAAGAADIAILREDGETVLKTVSVTVKEVPQIDPSGSDDDVSITVEAGVTTNFLTATCSDAWSVSVANEKYVSATVEPNDAGQARVTIAALYADSDSYTVKLYANATKSGTPVKTVTVKIDPVHVPVVLQTDGAAFTTNCAYYEERTWAVTTSPGTAASASLGTATSVKTVNATLTITPKSTGGSETVTVSRKASSGSSTTAMYVFDVTVEPPKPIETAYGDCVIRTFGATVDATTAPGELILSYTNPSVAGTLEIPTNVIAHILVVGGGGSGSSGGGSSKSVGYGGSGGGVTTRDGLALGAGTYACVVGAGGESVQTASGYSSVTGGEPGVKSSLSGGSLTDPLEGAAGSGGPKTAAEAVTDDGVESDITGTMRTYGKSGAKSGSGTTVKPGADGDAGTGNGGGGGQYRGLSGAGGSGIVVVRITGFGEATPPEPIDPPVEPLVTNKISYVGLEGAANPNPTEFTTNDLPITLSAPGARDGYTFAGWTPNGGVIPVGTTEDVTFTANWTAVEPPPGPDDPDVPTGEGEQWKSSYTISTNETTGVIWCEYNGNDRWWKLDGGDTSIAAPVFVDANPNEPKMSGSHTTRAKFYFKSGSVTGTTTWKVYTYTDEGRGVYPGYSTTGGSGAWSDRSGITITITVTAGETPPGPDDPDDPPVGEPAKFCVTPYLQHPASDAMTIIFFTDSACTATVTCGNQTNTTVGVWAEALTNNVNASDSSVWNNKLFRHRVRFEGLKANRSYGYTVTLAGGATYSDTFRTAPDKNTPIRFVSYADCETTKTPFDNYVKNLKQMKGRDPDFITVSGDLVARGGLQQNWDGFWQANAGEKGTIAGSIPVLTVIGNHDLFDNGLAGHGNGLYYDMQGEPSTERFLSYFEVESNGVDFAHAPAPHTETRDLSQLFHRVDYGPVTLIFLDTNNGQDGDTDADHDKDTNYLDRNDGQHLLGGLDRRKGCRHPDFNVGSPQYVWLTNNLAEAQAKSRFTFVFNHHCPYSRGMHNRSWNTGEDGSALALRFLTETFVRYGVDGWYCGHDELLEHSVTTGDEVLPDGTTRPHTLSIYDLGGSGDPSARNSGSETNPLEYNFLGNYSNGYYGFLETDVTMDEQGRWTCTVTPYSSGSQAHMSDRMIYVEDPERAEGVNDLAYAQHGGISGVSAADPSTWGWVEWTRPEEGVWDDDEPVELGSVSAAEATYAGKVLTPNLTVLTSDGRLVPPDHYEVTDWSGEPKNAGTYTAKVTGCVNVSGSATVSFTINPKPVTVAAKDASKKCDEEDPELEATVNGLIGGDTVSYTLTREPGEGVGTYPITASGEARQGNYSVTFAGATFKIKANGMFVDGEDSEIGVSGTMTVDVGAQAVAIGKLTVTGTGDLTISNCQNLAAASFDLNGLDGTVTYLYVSDSVNKSLPSGLADAIKGQADQKVKYVFRGTTNANGWNFGSWSGTAGKAVIQTHLVMEEGTHAWTVEVSSDNTSTYFGANGTDANPTLLVRDGATLNFTVHDLSGYKGTMNAGGVIRVNAGGKLNILALTSGSYHNFNYRQRLVLDPGSETTFDYSSSYLFVIHGGSDIGGDVTRAQIYVPESDGTAGPAILRRKSSGGAGLCINGNSQTRGGGCAIYVGTGSKLLLDSDVKIGESDSGTDDRTLAKYGAGELEITGEVTKDVAFKAYAGIITLPASSGAFNGGFTATADVTYRFPEGWEADAAYALGSGTVTGTAPAAETATVYVGNEKLTDRTLVYSGNTVSYAGPHEPTPFELLCVAAAAGEAYVIEDDLEFPASGVLMVPAGTSFVLDLKGHAITCHADGAIVNHGTLTILDSTKANPLQAHLTYTATETGKGYALIRSDGELVVDGVFVDAGFVNGADSEFGGGNTAIAATGGRVTVKNGAHVGGQTAIDVAGNARIEVYDSHAAGWRNTVPDASSRRGAVLCLSAGASTVMVSNATVEAEGPVVSAPATRDASGTVLLVDSVLATSRTTASFDLGSGVSVSLVRSIYVDRMAKWFPVTTALANAGADLKVGAGCLLAVASEGVIGFLDEGVTAAAVATRVWRTKDADDEALPPLTKEEEAKIAEVLSSSPDALLKANVKTIDDYTAYKTWVDAGVASGAIESEAAAKGATGSFFSFATAQPGIVDTEAITEEKVEVKKMEVKEGGSVKLTVGIADLPVGEGAKQEYLEQVFGVTGTGSLQESFAAEKVVYKQDMSRNDDGTVSYTVEPKTDEGAARPDQFYFKASVNK